MRWIDRKTIVGVRHRCRDCPNYDLCGTTCFAQRSTFHEGNHRFEEIVKPVVRGCIFAHGRQFDSGVPKAEEKKEKEVEKVEKEVVHPATCDICQNGVVGVRYKCTFPSSFSSHDSFDSIRRCDLSRLRPLLFLHPHHHYLPSDAHLHQNYLPHLPRLPHTQHHPLPQSDPCQYHLRRMRFYSHPRNSL